MRRGRRREGKESEGGEEGMVSCQLISISVTFLVFTDDWTILEHVFHTSKIVSLILSGEKEEWMDGEEVEERVREREMVKNPNQSTLDLIVCIVSATLEVSFTG